MKQTILYLSMSICLFTSCISSRSMQSELNGMQSDLFYELTSLEYHGEIKDSIYLDFIDYSNTDYYTTVKRNGGMFLPLILYNFQKDRFRTRLGEHSLSQLYREFLTDALLTECNSSTCFQLIDNSQNLVSPDSVFRLEVKVRENQTTGGVSLETHNLIWFEGDYFEYHSCYPHSSKTKLSISVRLTRQGDCLLDKTYEVIHTQPREKGFYSESYAANQASLNNMAECLSLATKEIVEEISQELHLTLSLQ